jgi:hypothetical protein
MERRELLSPGAIAAMAGAFAFAAEMPVQEDAPAGCKRVLRVYFDTDGSSHAIHAGAIGPLKKVEGMADGLDVLAWSRGES